jgi:predicted TIM-barrel fold metal-dependent hydrolase
VRESEHIGKAVLLALDRPYDGGKTHFYTDNEVVSRMVKESPNEFLLGASVNPERPDAIDALVYANQLGAVLNKLLPNTQRVNLGSSKYYKFWEKMSELEMPLLAHTGNEHLFIGNKNEYGDPSYLEVAAKIGVKIILSHCGSPNHFDKAIKMISEYNNVYGGLAAMGRKIRYRHLMELAKMKDMHHKLVFETDYPLMPMPELAGEDISNTTKDTNNPFDIYYKMLSALGFDKRVFYKGAELVNAHALIKH